MTGALILTNLTNTTCRQPEIIPVSLLEQLNTSKADMSCPTSSPYKPVISLKIWILFLQYFLYLKYEDEVCGFIDTLFQRFEDQSFY